MKMLLANFHLPHALGARGASALVETFCCVAVKVERREVAFLLYFKVYRQRGGGYGEEIAEQCVIVSGLTITFNLATHRRFWLR